MLDIRLISWHNAFQMRRSAGTSKPETGPRVDQRREPRQEGGGEVHLTFADGEATTGLREVQGHLLDRSPGGFRVQHGFPGLTCGQVVQFRFKGSSKGRARVVWTRILGDRTETGFFILP
jgi:hypothetical protein